VAFFTPTSLASVAERFVLDERLRAIPIANRLAHPYARSTMKKIYFPQNPLEPFQTGQVWRLENACLRIGVVGKLLVHYRHHKDKAIRGLSSLTSKRDLKKYLTENKATLAKQ
jgi:hypothetical protein